MSEKKNIIKLICLLLVLGLLILAYVLVSSYNRKLAEEEAQEQESSEISIGAAEAEDITGIRYTYGTAETEFALQDGTWVYTAEPSYPMDQEKISSIATYAAGLTATRTVDEGDESEFGLTSPELSLTVTSSDGTEAEYVFGDVNSFSSERYLKYGDTVYMVKDQISTYFNSEITDLVSVSESFPDDISEESVTKIILESEDQTYEITDSAELSAVLAVIKDNVTYEEWVKFGVSDEDMAQTYGLSDAGITVTVKYTVSADTSDSSSLSADATYSFTAGRSGDGYYYSEANGDTVFSTDAELYDMISPYFG